MVELQDVDPDRLLGDKVASASSIESDAVH
jgi:hypothetical protein